MFVCCVGAERGATKRNQGAMWRVAVEFARVCVIRGEWKRGKLHNAKLCL